MRGKGIGQTQMRRQLRTIKAATKDPDRHMRRGAGMRRHGRAGALIAEVVN